MRILKNPDRSEWEELFARPSQDLKSLEQTIGPIFDAVDESGDQALLEITKHFDGADLENLRVSQDEMKAAESKVSDDLKKSIFVALSNVERFHKYQLTRRLDIETMPGVTCWRKSLPIQSVGLYVPGGSAPLFSTVIMLAIPANIAKCKSVVMCTPPNNKGEVHPAILYAASLCGLTSVFKLGGAQAIAAMALGSQSIPKVHKIFGPGNQYVTAAKYEAFRRGTAIDIPAGPTEVLIICDASAPLSYVAADVLSQAEHGEDSQVVVICAGDVDAEKLKAEIYYQLDELPRAHIASQALSNSLIISFEDTKTAMSFSNLYAPEHLILATSDAEDLAESVHSAGSVFIGHHSPESVGDYASGTNHTLPTGGWARSNAGVSVDSFMKKVTFQRLTREGLENLGPHVIRMAEEEQLKGHANAVRVRLENQEA